MWANAFRTARSLALCAASAAVMLGCSSGADANAPRDGADASADGALPDAAASKEQKVAACRPDDGDALGACACATCPVELYDCRQAGDAVSTACSAILACASQSHCTTLAACSQSCATELAQNAAAAMLAVKLQACTLRCIPEGGLVINVGDATPVLRGHDAAAEAASLDDASSGAEGGSTDAEAAVDASEPPDADAGLRREGDAAAEAGDSAALQP